jgi:hypothetical protein
MPNFTTPESQSDGGSLKVFRGRLTMTPDDRTKPVVKPVMTRFSTWTKPNRPKCGTGL